MDTKNGSGIFTGKRHVRSKAAPALDHSPISSSQLSNVVEALDNVESRAR